MKTRSLFLALLLLSSLTIGVLAVEGDPDIPDGLHLEGAAGYSLRFNAADFLETLGTDVESLRGVMVIDLPEYGLLKCAGRSLLENEAVTTNTLQSLEFVPDTVYDVVTGFTVLPVYVDGTPADPLPVSITLTRKENHAPAVRDVELVTYKNIAAVGEFAAVDPDEDPLVFRVTSKAKRGEVEVKSDGTFVYTPFPGKTGKDTFTYVAVDPYGSTSEEGKVFVKIEKAKTNTTYADMNEHPSYYAALRLAEEGIFIGEEVCGVYYFRPDESVSRAEMVTMIMKITEMDDELLPATVTGFADDSSIPLWFKPYAQLAAKKGIFKGEETADGRKTMNADAPVTLSQTVTMLNNAAGIIDVATEFPDDIVVPVWAEQAAANMDAMGVVKVGPALDWNEPITREEAARMLVRTMDVYRESKEMNGLLSWVFGW